MRYAMTVLWEDVGYDMHLEGCRGLRGGVAVRCRGCCSVVRLVEGLGGGCPEMQTPKSTVGEGSNKCRRVGTVVERLHFLGQVLALHAHCVHTADAEAGILTQEYLSPV